MELKINLLHKFGRSEAVTEPFGPESTMWTAVFHNFSYVVLSGVNMQAVESVVSRICSNGLHTVNLKVVLVQTAKQCTAERSKLLPKMILSKQSVKALFTFVINW